MSTPLQQSISRLDAALARFNGGIFNLVNLRESIVAARECFAACAEELAALRDEAARQTFRAGVDD